jgi:hypothetical protein
VLAINFSFSTRPFLAFREDGAGISFLFNLFPSHPAPSGLGFGETPQCFAQNGTPKVGFSKSLKRKL